MIRIWRFFLLFVLLFSSFIFHKNINSMFLNDVNSFVIKPFYKNVSKNFVNNPADVKDKCISINKSGFVNLTNLFNWRMYAEKWEDFVENYSDLDLEIEMNISFNKNVKWKSSSLKIPLLSIVVDWVKIKEVEEKTTQWNYSNVTSASLFYICSLSGPYVTIRFKLETKATNNYGQYYFTILMKKAYCPTLFNYEATKKIFNEKISNKTLTVASDYSDSLDDEYNKESVTLAINDFIHNVLGSNFDQWKQYIAPYCFVDNSNVVIFLKFKDLTNNKNIIWEFQVKIKFVLTQNYWKQEFSSRLRIIPGKVVDVSKLNNKIITDEPLEWEGKSVYGTTASIIFDALEDGSETMKVNNNPIQVLDNQFIFNMIDQPKNKTNQYNILLERHDLNNFAKIIGSYEIKYLIKQTVSNLNLTWYAWNPTQNLDQNKLIQQFLENGKPNPNYDCEVNSQTGTKTQIIWVKHKAVKPFLLDPIDRNANIVDDYNYEQGFLAEGSVSGMGISQNFNDSWIQSVERVKLDDNTLVPQGKLEIIKADAYGSYFSLTGTYLYVVTDQKGMSINKIIIIGQEWQCKYAKFLTVLNNSKIAVSFWKTTQGLHLKNYLIVYKQLDFKAIQSLSFEDISSFWKEYVSDVESERLELNFITQLENVIDFKNISLNVIKMNTNDAEFLKKNVIKNIVSQLNKYQLENDIDYQIENLDVNVDKLLNYDSSNDGYLVDLLVNAVNSSEKVKNSTSVLVRNSKNYHFSQVVDFSTINFDSYQFNFSQFNSDVLKQWILDLVAKKFKTLDLKLVYLNDYHIYSLTKETLDKFINIQKLTKLEFVVSAEALSNFAINSTKLIIINDLGAEIAPIISSESVLNSDFLKKMNIDQKNWIDQKGSLIIISILIVVVVGTLIIIVFLKYRFKKGIGVKKNKSVTSTE